MKLKVLKDFVTKKGKWLQAGNTYDMDIPEESKFYKSLLEHEFIEEVAIGNVEDMEKNTIKSKLANVIIAGCDYAEGDKKHFTWDEAMALKNKLPDGWRLPTRSEWVLISEEFGQKDGQLDTDTMCEALGLGKNGYADSSGLYNVGIIGYYWSSTVSASSYAYSLDFYSGALNTYSYNRALGHSVRLVKDMYRFGVNING